MPGYYTFHLKRRAVSDFSSRIGGNASVFAGVMGEEGRDTKEGGILIKGRNIGAQRLCQRLAIFEPPQRERRIAAGHTTNGSRSHTLCQFRKFKWFNNRRYCRIGSTRIEKKREENKCGQKETETVQGNHKDPIVVCMCVLRATPPNAKLSCPN